MTIPGQHDDLREPTIVACASALGGDSAVVRLSGPAAVAIARGAGVPVPGAWEARAGEWRLAAGVCPCRALFAPAGRSFTGHDVVEVVVPGARDLVAMAVAACMAAGARAAEPGGFARQALASGRLTLDRAEAILAVSTASTAAAAARAVQRLRGALADELAPLRERLIGQRARVEAGLDFVEEDGVGSFDAEALRQELAEVRARLARWLVAADSLGDEPVVCLAGPANAGKSALFARLTGVPALVSPVPGTTRDWLQGDWLVAGRRVRLIDTAGWLDLAADGGTPLDAEAVAAGRRMLAGAALVLACSAPDAPLPDPCPGMDAGRMVVIATKCDIAAPVDARAALALSVRSGSGLDQLAGLVGARLGDVAAGEPRQQRLLAEADALFARLAQGLPADELLAEDLRRAGDLLGDLLGVTSTDQVLDAIFARFCIGK